MSALARVGRVNHGASLATALAARGLSVRALGANRWQVGEAGARRRPFVLLDDTNWLVLERDAGGRDLGGRRTAARLASALALPGDAALHPVLPVDRWRIVLRAERSIDVADRRDGSAAAAWVAQIVNGEREDCGHSGDNVDGQAFVDAAAAGGWRGSLRSSGDAVVEMTLPRGGVRFATARVGDSGARLLVPLSVARTSTIGDVAVCALLLRLAAVARGVTVRACVADTSIEASLEARLPTAADESDVDRALMALAVACAEIEVELPAVAADAQLASAWLIAQGLAVDESVEDPLGVAKPV